MKRTTNVTLSTSSAKALNVQKHFDQYGFPFTLNPTIGCTFGCKFCFSPIFVAKIPTGKRQQFFENVRVKMDLPTLLDKELTKYSTLPQHLKRVQINETSDYYLPIVFNALAKENRDILREMLEVFQKHDAAGNHWMLHILTKSNLILRHIDILKSMKHMVQIEISFTTPDENVRKQLEFFTIPTESRLNVVESLAKAGLFVRIMAMPFYGDENDMMQLKNTTFNVGAQAFKNKGLNYYDWDQLITLSYDDLINDRIERVVGRPDTKYLSLMIKSGETLKVAKIVQVLMPKPKQGNEKLLDWSAITKINDRLVLTDINTIDCGYSNISKLNWNYIK